MEENISTVFDIDFHVHTPESLCYNRRGKTYDESFIEFLTLCYKSNLKIVCITDHNTIRGYKRIIEIERDTRNQLDLYDKFIANVGEIPQGIEEIIKN